jgi:ankyrin repeat protein
MVSILIENGADVHRRDLEGKTALHIALEKGHEHVAATLLDNGPDVEAEWQNYRHSQLETPFRITIDLKENT